MEEKIKIKIILGSTRQGRFGERPANWINDELKNWEGVEAELIDLRDHPMPFLDSPISPSMMNMKYPHSVVQKWSEKINEADAFIIVSPEYNHGYSAVLKNAMDWLSPEWSRKPIGFVSYGSVGGGRAIEQLRQVVIELGMVPIRKSIHLNWDLILKVYNDKAISNADLFAQVRKGPHDHLQMFMDDLLWMAMALKAARNLQSKA